MKTTISRRDILNKTPLLFLGASLPQYLLSNPQEKPFNKIRSFDVTMQHHIKEQGNQTRLWIPLPSSTPYQFLTSNIQIVGNFSNAYISNTQIPTLYAEFNNITEPKIDLSFTITTIERNNAIQKVTFDANAPLPEEVKNFLQPTAHIQIDGIVKQTALDIIKNAKIDSKNDLLKAQALYEWVAQNMQRDESILGCGVGDAKAILESKKLFGKCTDISSVFVALCRSVGIPAREKFGIRLGQSRFFDAMGSAKNKIANITGAQHCRAEFYIKGYGWIPCDPGDVAKVKLNQNLDNTDSKIIALRNYLFGNWEMCWMEYNMARDFILTPQPEQIPLNNFAYPYGEVDGNTLDYYAPNEFSYTYTSIEQ